MKQIRSTLAIAEIEAERRRRGPPIIRYDQHGREQYEPDGREITRFVLSNNRVDIIQGPPGSGKTIGMFRRVGRHMMEQRPSPVDGIRRTRWFVARNTFPELKRTTIKTWRRVFPPNLYGEIKMGAPPSQHIRFGDVDADVDFLALDTEDDIEKLRSAEYTGGCFHEVQYGNLALFREARSRTNRYPEESDGGATWHGVLADANAPSEDHWLAMMTGKVDPPHGLRAEDRRMYEWPKDWGFFEQPPAVIKIRDKGGAFIRHEINLDAENLRWLAADYYLDALEGAPLDWINNLYGNECILVVEGAAVWPMFRREFHVAAQQLEAVPGHEIMVALDFGRVYPAALFSQMVNNRINVLHEMLGFNEGATVFAPQIKRELTQRWPGYKVRFVGDPKGRDKAQSSEQTSYDVFASLGMPVMPAPVKLNDIDKRIEAVAFVLNDNPAGVARLQISPTCRTLIVGMAGRYHLVREEDGELRPKKDKYSNLCDCLQYKCLAMGEGRRMVGLEAVGQLKSVAYTKPRRSMRRIPQEWTYRL